MKLYGEISKTEELDDGTIKVWGFASSESVDSDGETITSDAMKAAMADYMKFGAVREMHQAKAAGTAIEMNVQDDGRTWFGAHVVDSEAVKKVKANVYKGFSIGGKVTERDNINKTVIKGLKLVEVSLVDRPANPDAVFTMYKAESIDDNGDTTKTDIHNTNGGNSSSVDFDGSHGAEGANASASAKEEGEDTEAGKSEQSGPLTVPAIDALADMLNKGEITPEKLLALAKGEPTQTVAEDETAKAEAERLDIRKYVGEEVWDAMTAINALDAIMYLLSKEEYEGDSEEQTAALRAACASLKEFIVSEIQEDTSDKADKGGDLAKVSGELDLAKAEITKLNVDKADLEKRIKELEAKPAHGKALLKAVVVGKTGDATVLEDGETQAEKVAPVVDAKGEEIEVATLIKSIHKTGGVISAAAIP